MNRCCGFGEAWMWAAVLLPPGEGAGVLRRRVDGLLIDYTDHIPRRMLALIRGNQVPAVWLNTQEADCVFPDDFGAGQRAVNHLLGLGHKRIACLDLAHRSDAEEHYSVSERRAGYAAAMENAGLLPRIFMGEEAGEVGRSIEFLSELLGSPDRPTALVVERKKHLPNPQPQRKLR